MADQKRAGAGNGSGLKSRAMGQTWKVKTSKEEGKLNPCIWMQSGAVKSKSCNNFYNCTSCSYDLGMRKRVESGKQISWQDFMRRKSGLERICRHSLTNRIVKRACAYDYNCSSCDFDQFFEDVWSSKTGSNFSEIRTVKGFEVPTGHYFHNGHTWARIESGGHIRIGMDDFTMKLLGKADAFDLPLKGKELYQNKAGWGIKRDGKSADVLSPVDGVIVDVNYKTHENPELANLEPYGSGWLFIVHAPDIKEAFNSLMDEDISLSWMNNEIEKLEAMIADVSVSKIGDGGYEGPDIYGSLPELGWDNLVRNFLRSK
jgi:glycine cleavage system H lipoate-binding protein